ncbi:MerR family transcriptional regulator [Aneurinibacillus sp. Ricciae_BoGa-3]|uniref:MerR family transcriptional regulator n=1 Tax=Aneurinibacillus sp. Ricciae_BoGa-3 TaxID=3022697 RepID=UPI0023413185|nr:MerR family transcriptional regulator [Aneurinibacillus sp. Ricciae_BoGa-3]WCK56224.1 MerR family transcriptional regulator [Aneurinibacillus sp. Ricciae_BoGa-3]
MFTIGEAAKRLGLTTHTLRYYEKINLLPEVGRRGTNSARLYTEEDLQFIQFLISLKETGMPLTHIAHFVQDGCLLHRVGNEGAELKESVQTRLDLLQQHLQQLEEQKARLNETIALTKQKMNFYKKVTMMYD